MMSFRCHRLVVSVVRQVSTAAPTRVVNRLPLHGQARAFLSTRISHENLPAHALPYSTASSQTTNTTNTLGSSLPEKPDYLNDAESAIWDKLVAEFSPTEIMVQDISGGCGSMYGIEISSEKFRGANMLKQQRMVNAVLGDEMKEWHGVQLRTRVP